MNSTRGKGEAMTDDVGQDRPDMTGAWATALEARDVAAIDRLLAADVVLHSPLTDAFVFEGRRAVGAVFASAFELIDHIHVHTRLAEDRTAVVVFSGVVEGRVMEEMHLLRLTDGLVVDVTLMGRPVPALLTVMSRIPGRLSRHRVMPRAAGPAALGIRPVGALLTAVDRFLVPRLPPLR